MSPSARKGPFTVTAMITLYGDREPPGKVRLAYVAGDINVSQIHRRGRLAFL